MRLHSFLDDLTHHGAFRTERSAVWRLRFILLWLALAAIARASGVAQNSAGYPPDAAVMPDAPQPDLQTSSSAAADVPQDQSSSHDTLKHPEPQNSGPNGRAPQTKRILGIIPNFRSVSTDEKLPPQTVKEKFLTATDDSFDYSSVFVPALLAAYSMGTNATPEFGHGAEGYGRYFWHAAVDQTSENYMVEFVMPVLTREDTRFYTLSSGSFLKRTGYALSRVIITRTDAGRETFNLSEVVGAGASSGISTLYYPSRERTLSNVGTEWALDVGIDGASFVVKEFWPDINRHLFRARNAAGPA